MVAHPPAPGAPLRDRPRALTAAGTPPRVLLIKMSSQGDVIQALPAVEAPEPAFGCQPTTEGWRSVGVFQFARAEGFACKTGTHR